MQLYKQVAAVLQLSHVTFKVTEPLWAFSSTQIHIYQITKSTGKNMSCQNKFISRKSTENNTHKFSLGSYTHINGVDSLKTIYTFFGLLHSAGQKVEQQYGDLSGQCERNNA